MRSSKVPSALFCPTLASVLSKWRPVHSTKIKLSPSFQISIPVWILDTVLVPILTLLLDLVLIDSIFYSTLHISISDPILTTILLLVLAFLPNLFLNNTIFPGILHLSHHLFLINAMFPAILHLFHDLSFV
jgi:hypothetical protein